MAGEYSLYQWLLFFYIYSFFGWVFESAYVSVCQKRPVNRGFLRGPFLPIYGGGAVMMLYISEPFRSNLVLTYFAGVVGATLLELVTGIVMESIFKIKYWDYSQKKYNYKGYICLSSSLLWGFFTIAMNEGIHPMILRGLEALPALPVMLVSSVVTILLVFDVGMSVKEALDLRRLLEHMEEMRREVLRIRKRADVVIACLDDSWREFVENNPALDKAGEIYKGVELRYNKIRHSIMEIDILTEAQKEELGELKARFAFVLDKMEQFRRMRKDKKNGIRSRILANPTMTSRIYHSSLEMLKEKFRESGEE